METRKRAAIIAAGVIGVIVVVFVAESVMSGGSASDGDKAWVKAVEDQLQLNEKEYDKEGYDKDDVSPEEYLEDAQAKFDAMVAEGKMSAENAAAEMEAIRADIADKMN